MQTVYDALIALVGAVPNGYEIIAWIAAAVVFLWLVNSAFAVMYSIINWIGGK